MGSTGGSSRVRGSWGSAPSSARKRIAASSTERVIGPGVSRVVESGRTPCVEMRPTVTFNPTIPQKDAGRRTDPPVSVPTATGASPAATATPEPLDDPPGVRWTRRSQGFHGVPSSALVPYPPIANSTVWVLPSTIMPASTRRRARVAVTGETRPAHGFDPPVVTRPSSSTRSFRAIGMPWSGPIRWPERKARAAPSAASRASSA